MAPVSQGLNFILISSQVLTPQRKGTPEQRALRTAIDMTKKT
jgi:hypothetical protein